VKSIQSTQFGGGLFEAANFWFLWAQLKVLFGMIRAIFMTAVPWPFFFKTR
jgi:hypothetical protein